MFSKLKQAILKPIYPLVRLYWKLFQPKSEGARTIIRNGDQVLLVKTFYGKHWGLPGGAANRNERPEDCAVREAREETGINVKIVEKLGVYTSTLEGKRDTIHIFITEAQDNTLLKEWELEDARWFPMDALPEGIGPATKGRLEEYRSGKRNLEGAW